MRDEHVLGLIGFLIFVAFCILLMSSCVTLKTHRKQMNEEYVRGLQKARKIAYQHGCEDAVFLISGRINVEEMKK